MDKATQLRDPTPILRPSVGAPLARGRAYTREARRDPRRVAFAQKAAAPGGKSGRGKAFQESRGGTPLAALHRPQVGEA